MRQQATATVIAALGLTGLYLIIGRSPVIWQDEIQVVGHGLSFIKPEVATLTLGPTGEPATPVGLTTTPLSATAYWFLPGIMGHRWLAVFAAIASCCVLRRLALRLGCGSWATYVAVGYLLDPSNAQNFLSGRIDSLAHLYAFLGCLTLHCGAVTSRASSRVAWLLTSGALTAALLFSWPTAVALGLCHALTCVSILRAGHTIRFRDFATFLAGLLVTSAGFALIAMPYFPACLGFSSTTRSYGPTIGSDLSVQGLAKLLGAIKLSTVAILVLAHSCFKATDRVMATCTMLAVTCSLTFVLLTGPYIHRFAYTLPTILLGLACVLSSIPTGGHRSTLMGLRGMVAAGLILTMVGRCAVSILQWNERAPSIAAKTLQDFQIEPSQTLLDYSWSFGLCLKSGQQVLVPFAGHEKTITLTDPDLIAIPSGPNNLVIHILSHGYALDRTVTGYRKRSEIALYRKLP